MLRKAKYKFPIEIARWNRGRSEVVRIMLQKYNGFHDVSIRVWFMGTDGELRPTKTGINIGIKSLPQLRKALRKAKETASAMGLLDD